MNGDHKKVLEEATKAVMSIDKASLTELKGFVSPPNSIKLVFTALAEIFGQKNDWKSVLSFISKPGLLQTISNYKLDDVSPKLMKALNPYVKAPNMTLEEVAKASKAAQAIWKWILTVYTFGLASLGSDFAEETETKNKFDSLKKRQVWKSEPEKEDYRGEHEELVNIMKQIKKESIRELALIIRPSNKIVKVMEGICLAIGDPKSDWVQAKRLISQTTNFTRQLITLSVKKLNKQTVAKIKSYTTCPDLDLDNLIQFGSAVTGFQQYNQAVVKIWERSNGEIDLNDVPKLKVEPEPEHKRFASSTLMRSISSPKLRSKSKGLRSPKSRLNSNSPKHTDGDEGDQLFSKLAAWQEITENEVYELKKLHMVQRIIEAVHLILQGTKEEWGSIYKFLSNPNLFLNAVKNFEIKEVPKDNFYKLREIMKDPRLEKNLAAEVSPVIALAVEWLESIVDYRGFQQEDERLVKQRPTLKFTNVNHITDLKNLNNPSAKIKKVLEAVLILLGEKPDWSTARKLMTNPIKFLDTCNKLRIEDIPVLSIQKVKKYIADPDTDPSKLSLFSLSTAEMARWIRSVVNFWESLYVYSKAPLLPHDDDKILGHDPLMATEQDILHHMDENERRHHNQHPPDFHFDNSTVDENREESKEDRTGDASQRENGENGEPTEDKEQNETAPNEEAQEGKEEEPREPYPTDDEEYKALLKAKLDALEAATESFRGRVDQVGLDTVLEFKVIPQGVEKTFEIAAIMLGEDRDWEKGIKKMLQTDFVHRVINIKLEGVQRFKVQAVAIILKSPEVNREGMIKVSLAASELLKWAHAYVEAWKVLHRDYL